MIGNDAQGVVRKITGSSYFCSSLYQALEQIDIIIVVHTLHNGRETLQPHAGINRGFWQRMQLAGRVPIILHEHQVPDFDIAVTVFFRGPGWTTGYLFTVIIENLRTGPTGTGIPHGPEIIFRANAAQSGRVNFYFIQPDICGLIVIFKHRDPEPRRGKLEDNG